MEYESFGDLMNGTSAAGGSKPPAEAQPRGGPPQHQQSQQHKQRNQQDRPQQQQQQQQQRQPREARDGVAQARADSPDRGRHVAFDLHEDGDNGTTRTEGLRNADALHSENAGKADDPEPGNPRVFRNRRNSKLFWMDDNAAKACCNCEAPFTLLLRRHHCRACGFIFCGSCTTKRLDGTGYGLSGQVRVCDECYNYAKRVQDGLSREQRHHRHRLRAQHSSHQQGEDDDYGDEDDEESAGKEGGEPTRSGAGAITHVPIGEDDAQLALDGGFWGASATLGGANARGHGLDAAKRNDAWPAAEAKVNEATGPGALMKAASGNGGTGPLSTLGTSSTALGQSRPPPGSKSAGRASSRRLLEPMDLVDILNMDDDGAGAAGIARLGPSRFSKRATLSRGTRGRSNSWDGKPRERFETADEKLRSNSFKRNSSQATLADSVQSVETLLKEHAASDVSKLGDKEAVTRYQRDLLSRRLDKAVQRLVSTRVSALRDKRPSIILSEEVQTEWKQTLTRLGKQFCSAVRPYNMDFDGYCKLVSIPGGTIGESILLNGVVCNKHVVHRLMRQHIVQPRILLLEGAIEFSRERNRISSLDTLREQEEGYMKLVVHKITSMGVDLLIVGSSVSGSAQELLLKAGVSVVVNVRTRLLERIARLTGAYLLPNTDLMSILPNNSDRLEEWDPRGTCKLWTMRTFSTKLTDAQKGEQFEQITPRTQRGPPRKTLMFFEGCPPRLGASVCLRGASPTTLRHMEAILTSLITTTYTMKQQNRFFRDIGVCIGEERLTKPALVAQEDAMLEADHMHVCKVSICEKDQMHPAETKRLSFGTIGSDLTLGDYLRYRCFKSAPSVARQPQRSAPSSTIGASSTAAAGLASATRAAGQPADVNTSAGPGANAGFASSSMASPSASKTAISSPSSAQASSATTAGARKGADAGPAEGTDAGRPAGNGATFGADGNIDSDAGAAAESSAVDSNGEGSGPFGPTGVADAVFCVGEGRVYVFTGSLNRNDETHASLRDSLANIRREYVASGIRRLHNSESNRRSRALPIKNLPILTWSECLKCDATTEYKVLSKDAESLSYSRWLQIKLFYRARNVLSLLPAPPTLCRHSIFQDYVTYFELGGQVAGFEFEKMVPFETNLFAVDPEKPRLLPRYAERWLTETVRVKRDELIDTLRVVKIAFLEKRLGPYTDSFDELEGTHARADELKSEVTDGITALRACLKEDEDVRELSVLELYRVRRNLILSVQKWNKALAALRESEARQSPSVPPRGDPKRPRTCSDSALQDESLSSSSSSPISSLMTPPDGESSFGGAPFDLVRSTSVPHHKPKSISSGGLPLPSHMHGFAAHDSLSTSSDSEQAPETRLVRASLSQLEPVDLPLGFLLRGRPNLPEGFGNRIVFVYDDEPTSWIAYALNSMDHRQGLFALAEERDQTENFQSSRWTQVMRAQLVDPRSSALTLDFSDSHGLEQLNLHFSVKVYCPLHFFALRQAQLNWRRTKGPRLDPELSFLESLSRCDHWRATGGKSRSVFLKCRDGRFIAKSISSEELDMFLSLAPSYFAHLANVSEQHFPSALLKIVGVYTVTSKEGPSNVVQQISSKVSSRLNLADLDAGSVQALAQELNARRKPTQSGADSARSRSGQIDAVPLSPQQQPQQQPQQPPQQPPQTGSETPGDRAAEALRVMQAPPTPPFGPLKAARHIALPPAAPGLPSGHEEAEDIAGAKSDPLVDSALDQLSHVSQEDSFSTDDSLTQMLPRLTPTVGGLASTEASAGPLAKRSKGEIGIVRPANTGEPKNVVPSGPGAPRKLSMPSLSSTGNVAAEGGGGHLAPTSSVGSNASVGSTGARSPSAAAAAAASGKSVAGKGTSSGDGSAVAGLEGDFGAAVSGPGVVTATSAGPTADAMGAVASSATGQAGASDGQQGSSVEKAATAAPPPPAPPAERQSKTHYIVMENLFPPDEVYEAKFDLKGNFRNRLVAAPKKGEVLLDRNFRAYTNGVPLSLTLNAKRELRETIERDTEFLERDEIVDYSLLLGIPSRGPRRPEDQWTSGPGASDEDAGGEPGCGGGEDGTGQGPVLQTGIIDFLQLYNYRKMIESNVKRAGMIAGQLEPTVIEPGNYRARLLRAVDRNFIGVPPQPSFVKPGAKGSAATSGAAGQEGVAS